MTTVATSRTIEVNKMENKRIVWDCDDPVQVEQAREAYTELVEMGLTPRHEFDPALEGVSFFNDKNVWLSVVVPDSLVVLDEGQAKTPGSGQFSILTAKDGDKRIIWP